MGLDLPNRVGSTHQNDHRDWECHPRHSLCPLPSSSPSAFHRELTIPLPANRPAVPSSGDRRSRSRNFLKSSAGDHSWSSDKMDPDTVKSTLSNLAFGNVLAAAARDYQKEMLAESKAPSSSANLEVDLDELMDDPELEKLHADRIAVMKREAEKRESLKRQGHGEYREITEGDFLSEVTKGDKVICHFYHKEFYRCKIVDKHLKVLAPKHVDTKFVKLDAENAPFFVTKLGIKTLPCVILFRKGIATDRLVGFQDLGGKDDFPTTKIENYFIKKGIISEKKKGNGDDEEEYDESRRRSVRTSLEANSDSD